MTSTIHIEPAAREKVLAALAGPQLRSVAAPKPVEGARIAVVGLGMMGARHVLAAERRHHIMAGLVDPTDQPFAVRQNPALAKHQVKSLADLDPASVDVVVIATTADLHHRLAVQAIELGFSRIVVEKPVSQSVDEAIDMKLKAEARGARLVVNHGRRYCDAYGRVRALKQELGDVRSVALRFGGGALGCVGTHWIDLANTTIDSEPVSVHAIMTEAVRNPRGDRFVDPGASLFITYASGGVAFIDTRDDVGFMGGASFSFGKGELTWTEEFGVWSLRRRSAADAEKPLSQYGLPLYQTPFMPSETARLRTAAPWPYSAQEAVIGYAACAVDDALADGVPISGIDAAIQTIRVFAAARLSGATGRSVNLSDLNADACSQVYPIP